MSSQSWSPAPTGPNPSGATHDLEAVPNRDIRRLVRGLLAGHNGLIVDDAVLVADELVSNAHRHGDAPRTCRIALVNQGRRLRIEVADTSPNLPRIRTPDRFGGRGLVLVDRLASAWGVLPHAHHKIVWAELALDRAGSSGHAAHLAAAADWPRRS
ncbi:ATP-binding protein [Crossiella sp. SN42]|uniref:ATP-binding protein n=1 Tax=Crossiella sp. SN42 TaxID=2944808 RepID=UPI00207D3D44|nr:ATP-binding protein [Crossiella sp. SN42]MCO1574563.1 ATP-binding protein [Crossiella sp. SN42]